MTSIEWTRGDDGSKGETWNPVVGCSLVSAGCTNCYAMKFAHRGMRPEHKGLTVLTKHHGPRWNGKVRFVEEALARPLSWKKPRRVFVNSMSDLFHEELTNEQIAAVFGVMAACPQHTFQVLTKRPERMVEWFAWLQTEIERYAPAWETTLCVVCAQGLSGYRVGSGAGPNVRTWPLRNVWLGVSVEDQATADERIPLLLDTPAALRFVSYEPALGPVDFHAFLSTPERNECLRILGRGAEPLPGLDWIIIGGEAGPGSRPFDLVWARSLVAQGKAASVPVFVKQFGAFTVSRDNADWKGHGGGVEPTGNGLEQRWRIRYKHSKGADMNEWPMDLRVRQFPVARAA